MARLSPNEGRSKSCRDSPSSFVTKSCFWGVSARTGGERADVVDAVDIHDGIIVNDMTRPSLQHMS